ALGSQTAALEEPYEGTSDRGILTIEPAALARDVGRATAAGIAVAIHAIGDRAVRVALDAIAGASRVRAAPHRVEHLQLVRAEDLERFAGLGVVASMQPIHATSDRDLVDRHWGARARRAYPWRSLIDRGVTLSFGSDAPVEPIDPLLGIHAAVARKRPGDPAPWHVEQALTLDEALAGYAAGAAIGMGRAREAGTLRVGMVCDATIVDGDLAALPVAEWLDAKVSGTVVGGVVRHAAGIS
ncbi:MAG: amidohydrolase family protein, partial [Chloroflexi bacterium]|nr:amidohydrolase family protein [Chloroflexota bacterium]